MTIYKHNFLLAVASVLLLCAGATRAASITVYTDRNPAVLQESFQLIFEATGDVDDDPDFSPLEQDFQVISTSTSTSMNIINTKITTTKQWRIALLPLRTGELLIPAVSFGKDQSPQVTLTVVPAGSAAAGQDSRDIFLDVQVAPETAYVQQQVIYTVKLYRAVSTSNETLSEPVVTQGDAIIEQLDADRSYDTFIQGRPYSVFERSYGIYPQVSGKLSTRPVRFQAQLSSGARFSLDPFNAGASTTVRQSEALELLVEPVPAAYRGEHWLPAGDVKITEQWSKDPNDLLPDEPVTRSLTITAQGLTASQLVELPELFPDGFKQYPDKPELANSKGADGITGTRQQKNAVIPTQAGTYTLPEVSLPWWNTGTQSLEYAVLPARQIQVKSAAPTAAIDTPALPDPGTQTPAQVTPQAGETATPASSPTPGISIWQWLTAILAIAWLVTLAYILKNRKPARAEPPALQTANLGAARKAIERACRDDNPEKVKIALLQWAGAHPAGLSVTSLGDLEKLSNEELAAELRNLSRRLYSRTAEPWYGAPLWQAFLQEERSAATKSSVEPGKLEPLFRL